MHFNDYQREARKTAIYPKEYKIVYPSFGLMDEFTEFVEKEEDRFINHVKDIEIVKEIFDTFWYISNLISDIYENKNWNYNLYNVFPDSEIDIKEYIIENTSDIDKWDNHTIFRKIGQIQGKIKKLLRKDYTELSTETINFIINNIKYIGYYLIDKANIYGYEIEDGLQLNIDKLKDRQERGVLKGNGDNR